MKNIVMCCLCLFIISASAGCSKRNDDSQAIMIDKMPSRLTQIDLAFSAWYAEQMGAAAQIEYILDIKFGPIYNRRDPLAIISEQYKYVAEVKAGNFPDKIELDEALVQWHEAQINAANWLRKALGKPEIVADPKQDFKSILDIQRCDVVALIDELAKLGQDRHERWNDNS